MKKKIIIVVIAVLFLTGTFLVIKEKTKKDSLQEGSSSTTKDIDISVNLDNGEEKVDWDSLDTSELDLDNKSVTIDKTGVYTLTGNISNGSVIINTDGDVKLILDNITIKNESGPAIIIESANNTIIELNENSINTLEDGNNYNNTEYDGCLFSRDDLVLQGNGTLKITSNYLDGIVSNDDLKIVSGTYIINSSDDAIRGKDSVYIKDGNFTIESGADGIKTTNDTDSEKGYINIENGTFKINSEEDGFQAETKLIIYNGTYEINTSDGSSSETSAIHHGFYGGTTYDETSSKALKSVDNLFIKNGSFTINSKDDAIHSNNYIGIENGTINISSGDDGIHADNELIIDGGTINIEKSYEGLEANNITINNGTINISSNDDGINISGGNDSSSMGGRPGQNSMSESSGTLTINSGTIYVNATGDGLDANGNIIINGGTISVDGPTNDGNGALDYDTTFVVNGGTFIAVGSSGMVQGVSTSSKQYSLMFNLNGTYTGQIKLVNSSGDEIFSYTPKKSYSSIVISNSKIKENETYTIKIDNKEIASLKATSTSSSYGNSGYNPGGGPRDKK